MSAATRIAPRYAKALLDLAVEQNNLEKVFEDMTFFKEAVKNRDLYLLLKSPIVSASKKESIFNALFENNFDKVTFSFFKIILDKGREEILPEIATEFLEQYKQLKQISSATITSAVPLDDATLTSIKEKLIASGISTANLEFTTKVDENLIGGYIVQVGDKLYDTSIASQLRKLRDNFDDNLHISQIMKN